MLSRIAIYTQGQLVQRLANSGAAHAGHLCGDGLNLALTGLLIFTGVMLQTPGAPTAVVALTRSFWIEIPRTGTRLGPVFARSERRG